MPGQRKRKRKRAAEQARSWPTVPGHWQPVFSTQDHAEFTAEIKRLHQTGAFTDPSQLRCDMFCGRLEHPSTYRLSVFVPQTPDEAAGGEGGEGGEGGSRRPGSALPDGSEGAESPHPGSEE